MGDDDEYDFVYTDWHDTDGSSYIWVPLGKGVTLDDTVRVFVVSRVTSKVAMVGFCEGFEEESGIEREDHCRHTLAVQKEQTVMRHSSVILQQNDKIFMNLTLRADHRAGTPVDPCEVETSLVLFPTRWWDCVQACETQCAFGSCWSRSILPRRKQCRNHNHDLYMRSI